MTVYYTRNVEDKDVHLANQNIIEWLENVHINMTPPEKDVILHIRFKSYEQPKQYRDDPPRTRLFLKCVQKSSYNSWNMHGWAILYFLFLDTLGHIPFFNYFIVHN